MTEHTLFEKSPGWQLLLHYLRVVACSTSNIRRSDLVKALAGLCLCAGLLLPVPSICAAGQDTDMDGLEDSIDPDDDNDGMPDFFEMTYGLNRLDDSDGILDADSDSFNNLSEFHAGTSPVDADDNPGGLYIQHFKVVSTDGNAKDLLGSAVSLSGDTAVIGAQGDYNGSVGGSAYVYVRDVNGVWNQQAKLTTSDGAAFGGFGRSVSVSGDIAVIGAPLDDQLGVNSGAAYVFRRDASEIWSPVTKLLASDGAADDRFGQSVSLSGDTVIIGAYRHDAAGAESGSVYVFVRDGSGVWSQQAKLVANDAGKNSNFGRRVSLSGDTAAVSASWSLNNGAFSGAAYVYARDGGGVWSEQAKLLASDGGGGNSFGESISISGDTVVVGAEQDDVKGFFSGSAYVYVRDGNGVWSQQAKLIASNGRNNQLFGNSVSVSGDVLLVGAPQDVNNGGNSGAAYVFLRDSNGSWSQQAKLMTRDGTSGDVFGKWSVSASGNTLAIGATGDDDNGTDAGSAYLYSIPGSSADTDSDGIADWGDNCPSSVNTNQKDTDADTQGDACDMDDDNDGVLDVDDAMPTNASEYLDTDGDGIGNYKDKDDDNDGMLDSFELINGLDLLNAADATLDADGDGFDNVTEFHAGTDPHDPADNPGNLSIYQYKLLASDGDAKDSFGQSVSITGDTAVIGAHQDNNGNGSNAGAAYIYVQDINGTWVPDTKLIASDGKAGDRFGLAVSVSGNTALIGASNADGQSLYTGSAYVFARDGNGIWSQQAKLTPDDGAWGDSFGWSVSLSVDVAVIGACLNDSVGTDAGAAYIFERDVNGLWNQQAKLVADDGAVSDGFGCSVSVSDDTVIVGASGDDDNGSASGSAYVYVQDTAGVWIQQAKLLAGDGALNDGFGKSVAVSGDTVVIGASGDDDSGSASGSAYVFVRDGNGVWSQQAKLLASDGAEGDGFGGAVSVSGNTVVIGSSGDDDRGSASGSAYVYARDINQAWSQRDKLSADYGSGNDYLGGSVAVSGDLVITGAIGDDDYGSASGSAHIFHYDVDMDGIIAADDNCPLAANPEQTDTDGDGAGNACDSDDDNDQLLDVEEDVNGNGMVDAGETDPLDADTDGDGFEDGYEVYVGTDPLDSTSTPPPVAADGDINIDGVVDVRDVMLAQQVLTGIVTIVPAQLVHGDVAPLVGGIPDPDGLFTAGDLAVITQKALGMIDF